MSRPFANDTITVVVPVLNRAASVMATLDSIGAQTLRPDRIILVDNGSTDGSDAVLRHWADANRSDQTDIMVISCSRRGAACARNAGLAAVESEWTMFFDSDDLMSPTHIQRAMETTRTHPDADIIGWDIEFAAISGKRQTRRFSISDAIYSNLFFGSLSTQRYMARTRLFRDAGGWMDDASMYDDCELGMRLLALNPTMARADGPCTVTVRETPGSIMTSANGRIASMAPALDAIERSLTPETRHWTDLLRLLMCLTWAKDDAAAKTMAQSIFHRTPPARRLLWRLFALYTRSGGRGVARLYKPLRRIGF